VTPLPACLVPGCIPPYPPLIAWRIDKKKYERTWDSGEGSRLIGGRWNSAGRRIVYCSIDPATTILELAVHHGFDVLDTVPHVLTWLRVADPARVFIVQPGAVPNRNWLHPCHPSAGQQAFGDRLLAEHSFVVIPSAAAAHSWNLMFDSDVAAGQYAMVAQEPFALDPRLNSQKRV